MTSLDSTASWVVVCRKSGKAVHETYQKSVADKVNIEKYRVVPIQEWLGSLNASPSNTGGK